MGVPSFRRTAPRGVYHPGERAGKLPLPKLGGVATQKGRRARQHPPPVGHVPSSSQLSSRKAQGFAPVDVAAPTGAAQLIAKVTIEERRENGGQKTGQHVP